MSRILVVDDQEFPRQAVVDLIEHEFGVTAATAASAGEALAAMAEQGMQDDAGTSAARSYSR